MFCYHHDFKSSLLQPLSFFSELGDKEKQCRITGVIWIGKEDEAGTTNHLLVEVYADDVRIIAESYLNRMSESNFKPGAMGSFDLQAKCATPNGIRVMLEGSDAMLLDRVGHSFTQTQIIIQRKPKFTFKHKLTRK